MQISEFIEDLKWRGLFQDMVAGTEEYLNSENASGYIGFDPTADSLHLGSFQQIILLKRMQLAGIRPIALMGGATGRVGDPTGKTEERQLLDNESLQKNIDGIKKQLSKFIQFGNGPKDALLVDNYDWFKDWTFLDFIREVGKHITVGYMMSKDSVQNRLETGLSFTEFTYQLIQGYDFLHLFDTYKCKLQMGGSDQWGNITTGVELIRRIKGEKGFAITSPLVTRADGSKFGKTASGENIWLDPEKTSPYKFYQFLLNRSDDEAKDLLRRFSFKDRETIKAHEIAHLEVPHLRLLQKALAEELTILVHSESDLETAQKASQILFGTADMEALQSLSIQTIEEIFEGVPQHQINRSQIDEGMEIISFLVEGTKIFNSNGQARQKVGENAISINKQKINLEKQIDKNDLLHNQYILVQQGKKNYFLVHIQ
jgi:tyrosyl-tRNA synthetase